MTTLMDPVPIETPKRSPVLAFRPLGRWFEVGTPRELHPGTDWR